LTAAGARLAFLAGDLDDVDRLASLTLSRGGCDAAARCRATHARGVLALYEGRHHDAVDAFAAVTDAEADASLLDRLDAFGGLGLALCYSGQRQEAQRVVDRHRAIADTVGSVTYRAFADYVQGEIDLAAADIDTAAHQLRDAAERAWSVGATFVWGVAATVLAGVLVRHRPPSEARAHLPVLLQRWRRSATWTQLWTTLRLVAEFLADQGDDDVAATILLAADRDPAAPRLSGDDLDRDGALRDRLRERLGDSRYTGIGAAVTALERLDVLDRAVDAIERLDIS
jgi:hypothetical protein